MDDASWWKTPVRLILWFLVLGAILFALVPLSAQVAIWLITAQSLWH